MSRVIKDHADSQAGILLTDSTVRVQGGRSSFLYGDPTGIYITGPVSFLAQPENIRIGVDYVLPPISYGFLPSTSAHPRPMYIYNSPVEGVASVLEEVQRLLQELI